MSSVTWRDERPGSYQVTDQWEGWLAFAEEHGWGDGLPLVPPTRDRVARLVEAARLDGQESLGRMPPSWSATTVEKLATNAVMAGADERIMPALVAAMRAMLRPEFDLYAVQATTNPVAPAVIVSGPARHTGGFCHGYGYLGPGNKSNATLGRAIRLALMNIGGALPGDLDRATGGQPGKYTLAFAENEEASPWEPFGVSLGLDKGTSGITVFGAVCLVNHLDNTSDNARDLAAGLARGMSVHGYNTVQGTGQTLLLLSPEHAATLAREFPDRRSLQEFCYANAVVPTGNFGAAALSHIRSRKSTRPGSITDTVVRALGRPDDLLIAVAGGDGQHSVIAPGIAMGQALTEPIFHADLRTRLGSPLLAAARQPEAQRRHQDHRDHHDQ